MKRLSDVPLSVLKAVADALEDKCQPATIVKPEDLGNDTERFRLAFKAGRASVLKDINEAIASHRRDAKTGG